MAEGEREEEEEAVQLDEDKVEEEGMAVPGEVRLAVMIAGQPGTGAVCLSVCIMRNDGDDGDRDGGQTVSNWWDNRNSSGS